MPKVPKQSTNGHAGANGKPQTAFQRHFAAKRVPGTDDIAIGPQSRLQWVGGHFDGFQKNGRGYVALCPVHDDSNPSLSLNEGKDGHILIRCHAGCPTKDVLAVVGLQMADLMPGAKRIVAAYDYVNDNGELLYQSLRMEPKDFRCRRPDGNGGWIWKGVFDDVDRVLYRLPELLAADPGGPVFVVEGEKDADRLAALGLVATTNVTGAKSPWLKGYTEALRGKHAVLLPDNDPAGWDRVNGIARHLRGVASSVKIVGLPGLPPKGDVSDWLDSGGSKTDLLRLVAETPDESTGRRDDGSSRLVTRRLVGSAPDGSATPVYDSSNRRTVEPSSGPGESFPVEVFPKLLQRFIRSVADALPCPPDFPGALMLPVLGTFIGRKRCIEVKREWREYPLLWVAGIGRSGERKTPAFEKVTGPLRDRQKRLLAEHAKRCREWESLPAKEKLKTPRPRLRQILTTDSTIEALKDVLAGNPTGIVFPADELAGWVRAMSQYKGGKGDDRQHWLSIWSGVQIVSNRRDREPVIINDPFVCVTGGIQPDALGDLIDDGREDGFAARILFAYPDPIPHNDWTDESVENTADYAGVCESLWDLEPSKAPVTFSAAAKALWVEWVNSHRRESPPDNLRPMWSKCEGYVARLTLILFLARKACHETTADQIDEASIGGAIKLIRYFKSHARRVYGIAADQSDRGRIGNALRWIRKRGGTATARDVGRYGLTKDSEAAKELFHDLADLGHGAVTEEARGSVVFRLHDPTLRRDDDPTVEE